jgi:VRR-NUC domain
MTRLQRPEQADQRAVLANLEIRAAPNTYWFHVPLGGYRTPAEAAILKGLGARAGVPDLILIRDGQTYALELKAPGGKLSATQKETIERMKAAGAVVGVAHGVDEALRFLELNRLLRGTVQ